MSKAWDIQSALKTVLQIYVKIPQKKLGTIPVHQKVWAK